jgi:biofilm PGA synthesis N-glycosyltransferase PgaC
MVRISEIAAMSFIFILIFLSYLIGVFGLITGWIKAMGQPTPGIRKDKFISVIVPCRNEEKNIGLLLEDLAAQNYPTDKVEWIVVNDHSEDNTVSIVNEKFRSSPVPGKLINNPGHGKKSALSEAIALAQGKIILTTDADCRVSPNWIRAVNASFRDDSVKMTFGPVRISTDKMLFSSMQAIEFASLIGSGAATAAFGSPTMCNGANLAFRKETFLEVNGYSGNEHVASGDDEFLMRKIEAKYPDSINFNSLSDSIITTLPQVTLREFFQQRARWAGKWKYNEGTNSKILAIYVFLFHLSVIMLPVFVLAGDISVYIMLLLLTAKAIVECIFLRWVSSWLGVRWNWPAFLVLQVVYSFYAVGVALGALVMDLHWKGRPISVK